ncbi:hypothetical protein E2562_035926 [Oryza meyeriana var. granulata]|nr:hypothetical protein E2562_035926 [Oryza meyeriana var. granulata]KAF0915363.1 hypothetical protein E2562_035926 [Oryza meyeriana var. granulata]
MGNKSLKVQGAQIYTQCFSNKVDSIERSGCGDNTQVLFVLTLLACFYYLHQGVFAELSIIYVMQRKTHGCSGFESSRRWGVVSLLSANR